MMKYLSFFWCDHIFNDLSWRHAYLSNYYMSLFENHIQTSDERREDDSSIGILDKNLFINLFWRLCVA